MKKKATTRVASAACQEMASKPRRFRDLVAGAERSVGTRARTPGTSVRTRTARSFPPQIAPAGRGREKKKDIRFSDVSPAMTEPPKRRANAKENAAATMSATRRRSSDALGFDQPFASETRSGMKPAARRSEEHTSELQSRQYLVCRLL